MEYDINLPTPRTPGRLPSHTVRHAWDRAKREAIRLVCAFGGGVRNFGIGEPPWVP